MAAAAVVGATIMVATQNPFLGVAVMMVVGVAGGLLNGIAVAVHKTRPLCVTLAMTVASGFAVWMIDGTSIYGMPYEFSLTVMSRIAVFRDLILFVPSRSGCTGSSARGSLGVGSSPLAPIAALQKSAVCRSSMWSLAPTFSVVLQQVLPRYC